MKSNTPATPDPGSLGSIAAQLLIGSGGNAKTTLCGLPALRNVSDVFTPAEVSCRECRKRWQQETASRPAPPSAGLRATAGPRIPAAERYAAGNRWSLAFTRPWAPRAAHARSVPGPRWTGTLRPSQA
jgi:hypothetical protein